MSFPFLLILPALLAANPSGPAYNAGQLANAVIISADVTASKTSTDSLIAFAQTLKGIRYKYASADPAVGFDCSGFVKYVFNHFNVDVPRSSRDFAKIGTEVQLGEAQPGDVILFTGSNSQVRKIGHVGIVIQGGNDLQFIHASSGKKYSVTESPLTEGYKKRFMKVVRILE